MSMQTKPSIVFVHGDLGRRLVLWQGDPTLQAEGYEVWPPNTAWTRSKATSQQ